MRAAPWLSAPRQDESEPLIEPLESQRIHEHHEVGDARRKEAEHKLPERGLAQKLLESRRAQDRDFGLLFHLRSRVVVEASEETDRGDDAAFTRSHAVEGEFPTFR